METVVFPDAEIAARVAAAFIAAEARAAIEARGRFIVAFSGGRTPWLALRALAGKKIPWERVQVAQVDERIAPEGTPERNLTLLSECLGAAPLRPDQLHAMPVEAPELENAPAVYARELGEIAGRPPVFDLVHLGLGSDGHTASLFPGDPALDAAAADVALTGVWHGQRRMTLTLPLLNRARRILWLVCGPEKAAMLARLRHGDETVPAGRIRQDRAIVFADRLAAGTAG